MYLWVSNNYKSKRSSKEKCQEWHKDFVSVIFHWRMFLEKSLRMVAPILKIEVMLNNNGVMYL